MLNGCAGDSVTSSTTLARVVAGEPCGHDDLVPGETVRVDLDNDGVAEQILLDPHDHAITIVDGPVSYRSRERWDVVQAALGDLDGDGMTEIVALLDSETGRHVGLFAYFGGEYRERLVSQAIDPAPSTMRIVASPSASDVMDCSYLLELEQPSPEEAGSPQTIVLRWNGCGFTRIEQ